jgi:hypothetical protein
MIKTWLPRMAAISLLALGLAGCVAYPQPAPYYAPSYGYAAPAPSLNLEFGGGGGWRDDHERHWH